MSQSHQQYVVIHSVECGAEVEHRRLRDVLTVGCTENF
jgi:hypothetical protein